MIPFLKNGRYSWFHINVQFHLKRREISEIPPPTNFKTAFKIDVVIQNDIYRVLDAFDRNRHEIVSSTISRQRYKDTNHTLEPNTIRSSTLRNYVSHDRPTCARLDRRFKETLKRTSPIQDDRLWSYDRVIAATMKEVRGDSNDREVSRWLINRHSCRVMPRSRCCLACWTVNIMNSL